MIRRLFASIALAVLLCVGLSFSPPPDPVTYYVNKLAAAGGDGTTQALTGAHCAWDALADVNAASFAAGDSVLISRGTPAPVYREQLTIPSSGSAGLPITFGAYGTGANPIISGATVVSGFTVSWQTVYSAAVGGSAYNVNSKVNWRSSIPTANLIGSGTKIRITYLASNVQDSTIDAASFGLRSGTTEDYATAPTAITFNSGSASVTIPVGTSKVSDEITFTLDQSSSYLHHEFQNILSISQAGPSGQTRYNKYSTTEVDESATVDISGYTETATKAVLISLIEAQNTRFYQAALTTEPQQVFFAGVKGYKRTSVANCIGNRDWYWASNILYVYTDVDPTTIVIAASTLTNCINTNGKSYLTIQNLDVRNANAVGVAISGSGNVILESCLIRDHFTDGINLSNSGDAVTGNVLRYNDIYYNIGNGIYFSSAATKVNSSAIYYNLIHQNNGAGIRINNSQTLNTISNNVIDMNRTYGLHLVAASGFTAKNNILMRNTTLDILATATSDLTHTNNSYFRENGNTITYNGTSYTLATITTFEATAIATNPLAIESNITRIVQASHVDLSGNIWAGIMNTIQVSADNGITWTSKKSFAPSGATIRSVFVAANGYVYCSPSATDLANDQKGLWRSTDGGANWTRVLDLSVIANLVSIWGIDEDSSGRIFVGVYSLTDNAPMIYRSIDNGGTFSSVYTMVAGKHVHSIGVNRDNNYVYATFGDATATSKIMRSIDNGDNWVEICAGIPRCVPIAISPTARIFGSDADNGRIFRTTDDSTYSQSFSETAQYWAFWAQYDSSTGYFYVSFVADASFGFTHIYRSIDDGLSWHTYRKFKTSVAMDGSVFASNIVSSKILCNIFTGNTIQNAILMNLGNYDNFILQPTSPCINAGTNVGLTTDYAGTTVPQGTLPDIGAYEYAYPIISSLLPVQGKAGTTVTITGTGFGASAGTVIFNGVSASITSWADTSIVVKVPGGAKTGNVVVTTSGGYASAGSAFQILAGFILWDGGRIWQ